MSIHVICYHRVLSDVSDDLGTVDAYHHARGMLHSLADFRSQLDALQGHCQIVDAAGFLRARACEAHAKPPVLLTFDDGYADFASVVMPELSARGLPCVLFPTKAPVTTGYVPPRDQVYALLEYLQTPEVSAAAAEGSGYNPTVTGADALLSPAAKANFQESFPGDALANLWHRPAEPSWFGELRTQYADKFKAA